MGPEYLYLILLILSAVGGLTVSLFWSIEYGRAAAILGAASVAAAIAPLFLIGGGNALGTLYWGMFGVAAFSSICFLSAGLVKTAVAVAFFGGSFLLDQALPNDAPFSFLKLPPQASVFFAPLLAPALIVPSIFRAIHRRTETMVRR